MILVMSGQVQLSAHEKKVSLLLFLLMTLYHKERGLGIGSTQRCSCAHQVGMCWLDTVAMNKGKRDEKNAELLQWVISWGFLQPVHTNNSRQFVTLVGQMNSN